MKKGWKILLCVLAFFMLADLVYRAFFYRPSELTVSARFRIPVPADDRDYDYYLSDDNGYRTVRVRPAEAVGVAEGMHGAPYRPARMKNGLFRTGWEYGPDAIQGIIRQEDILKTWPDAPIQGDWPFHIYFYNTSTGRTFRMFLDLSYDAETNKAEAVFYVFYPKDADPATDRWEGKLGDDVVVGMEI